MHTTQPAGGIGPLGLAPRVDPLVFEAALEVPSAVRVVPVDGGSLGVLACDPPLVLLATGAVALVTGSLGVLLGEEIGDELFGHTPIARVSRGDVGVGNDLGVRIHRHMTPDLLTWDRGSLGVIGRL